MVGREVDQLAVEPKRPRRYEPLAQPRRALDDRVEHRLNVGRRAGDDRAGSPPVAVCCSSASVSSRCSGARSSWNSGTLSTGHFTAWSGEGLEESGPPRSEVAFIFVCVTTITRLAPLSRSIGTARNALVFPRMPPVRPGSRARSGCRGRRRASELEDRAVDGPTGHRDEAQQASHHLGALTLAGEAALSAARWCRPARRRTERRTAQVAPFAQPHRTLDDDVEDGPPGPSASWRQPLRTRLYSSSLPAPWSARGNAPAAPGQAGRLDGDVGLIGELRHQLDLPVAEGMDPLLRSAITPMTGSRFPQHADGQDRRARVLSACQTATCTWGPRRLSACYGPRSRTALPVAGHPIETPSGVTRGSINARFAPQTTTRLAQVPIPPMTTKPIRAAQCHGTLDQRRQDRIQVEGRTADHLSALRWSPSAVPAPGELASRACSSWNRRKFSMATTAWAATSGSSAMASENGSLPGGGS